MDYRKHMLGMNPFEDPLRRTGRTTRMLQNALNAFSVGFNIVVTGFTYTYAVDLQRQFCSQMELCGMKYDRAEKHFIVWNGIEAVFTHHNREADSPFINPLKMYLIFNDHHDPNYEVFR